MLLEHILFLARVNQSAAKVLKEDLLVRIKNLEKAPNINPIFFSNSLETEYRKLVYKRYLILYAVEEHSKTVRVKLVWDTRKDNFL